MSEPTSRTTGAVCRAADPGFRMIKETMPACSMPQNGLLIASSGTLFSITLFDYA
jgi:hypothetical protein